MIYMDDESSQQESLLIVAMLLLLSQIIHNLSDGFLDIIDSLAYILSIIPISSTLPMMLEDISSKRSCICFNMFCTNWFSYLVLGSSVSF